MGEGEGEKEEEKKKKRRRRRKKEEEKRRIQVWNSCLEVWNISFVWNTCLDVSLELFGNFGIENTCLSWVRKTLTFQYKCFWLV